MNNIRVFVPRNDFGIVQMFQDHDSYRVVSRVSEADIVCFQGGSDVSPHLYGENILKETRFNPETDKSDKHFFYQAQEKNIPMVGICRGAQFLNVMNGGHLWQDVNNHMKSHYITDLLIGCERIWVSSTHHQMMIPAESAITLAIAHEASVFKSDGQRPKPRHDTEVLWYERTKCLCVQFHPEYARKGSNSHEQLYFFDLIDHLIL